VAVRRLALAFVISAGAHAVVLANAAVAPGIREFSLLTPRPLQARLQPMPDHTAPDGAERLSPRIESPSPQAPVAGPAEHSQVTAQAAGVPGPEIYFRSSELDERAEPLNQVDLEYPEAALASGTSGAVTLQLRIDHSGALQEATVLDSTPAGLFDKAALAAVRQLQFRPAMRRGVAVGSIKTIEIPFFPDCKRTGSCIGAEQAGQSRP